MWQEGLDVVLPGSGSDWGDFAPLDAEFFSPQRFLQCEGWRLTLQRRALNFHPGCSESSGECGLNLAARGGQL